MDRALGYELRGREFESLRVRHITKITEVIDFGDFFYAFYYRYWAGLGASILPSHLRGWASIANFPKSWLLCYNNPIFFIVIASMSKHTNTQAVQTPTTDTPTIAKPLVRLSAIVYDGMLILAMLFLVGAVLAVVGTLLFLDVGTTSQDAKALPLWYQNGVMTPAFVLTLVGFYGIFWRKSGQTLGMQTWRLKTVDANGQLLSWGQSFKRIISACLVPAICAVVGAFIHGSKLAILLAAFLGFLFNFLFCVFNTRGLAVHDMLSNTITLKVPKIAQETLWQSLKRRKSKS